MDSYKAAKTEHVNELATKIGAGMNGQLLKSAIQDYKMAMYIAGQTVFYGEIKQELEKNDPKNAIDILRNRYWNIELRLENPHTGALNYDQRDADRAEILADARAIGLEESDITVRMPTGNAMVDSALNQYHTDMETLKPMWEVDEKVLDMFSSYERTLWERYKRLDPAAAREFREANSAIGNIDRGISNMRRSEREADFRIDVAYVRQYDVKPATMAGWEQQERMTAISQALGMTQ